MNMDTSEISIDRIVGFAWNDGGTDVEYELPTSASSPNQIVVPAIRVGINGIHGSRRFGMLLDAGFRAGVIGSDVPWLECPACNALTWVITVTE